MWQLQTSASVFLGRYVATKIVLLLLLLLPYAVAISFMLKQQML